MRVIAGAFKRRTLLTPGWEGLRPTSDRLRETLFDVLGASVAGARVLDGCAGTGALGLEALSRGAAHVVFVDRDPRAVGLIRRNVARCDGGRHCTVLQGALPPLLRTRRLGPFDLVLLDPPYGAPDIGAILAAAAGHLAPSGVLVLERARRDTPPTPPTLEPLRQLRAGDSVLEWFTPRDTGPTEQEP